MKNKRLVFMNSGMHFWNREKDILAELNSEYEILLIICHSENKNYSIEDIMKFCEKGKISLLVINDTERRARNPKNVYRAIRTISTIKKFKPDLIYIENFSDPYFAIFSAFSLDKSKVIISVMDYELHPYEKNKIRFSDKFYQLIYLKYFNNFQLFSIEQTTLLRTDYPSKKIFYIPLYLINNDFVIRKKRKTNSNGCINFLFFGKIHYYKGLDILIKAGNMMTPKYSNFKITIAGYSEDFSEYEMQIENKNFFDLKIDYLSKNEITELMMEADIFVLPYRQVTQSGPLMMAFNFGVIPLASDLSGFLESIINGYNGFLFKRNSVNDLFHKMEEILHMSREEKESIHENLANYVAEKYNPIKFANSYKSMFDSVIDGQ